MENKILIECLRSQAKTLITQAELLNNLATALEKDNTNTNFAIIHNNSNTYKYDLPNALNSTDVAKFMGISKSKAYELFHRKDFPKITLGRRMIVSREMFLKWVEQQSNVNN